MPDSTKRIDTKLDEILDELKLSLAIWHGDNHEIEHKIDAYAEAKQALTQLIEEIVNEVIGADMPVTGHMRPQGYVNVNLTESYRNDLRQEQRTRSNQLLRGEK